MKIIILGAGQVGTTVAQSLANEANDITVVDQQPALLKELQDRLDIKTVTGHASHPEVLYRAGIEDADLVLAVTNSDETNMVACQIAHTLFHTPTRLARVRSPDYLTYPELFAPTAVPVDVLISPEQLVTTYIRHLIEQPGVLQILDFLDGKAQLVAVRAHYGGPLVGKQLRNLAQQLPKIETRVAAIFRRDRAIIPDGDTVIEADDEVFFLAAQRDIPAVVAAFRRSDKPNRRVIIAGGGNIGKRLAELIESKYRVKIIERDPQRCRHLAETLHKTVILQGDAGDADLLKAEDIEDTDVYCAVTNDDEANILSAMLAKRLGARKTLTIINRQSYVDLAQGTAVDIAVSPAQVTIGALLTHIRRGDFVAVHSLRRGAAEAIEIIAHGDHKTSRVVGRRIDELPLPEGTTVGAIAREKKLLFPHKDMIIEPDDHIVLFLSDKRKIAEVERLFQVAITFI
ncbi:MAG: Trk system potassium transporter TrkA [Gammaproteobacteria bacterium]|nr:Trk system potassium transporter TrkA [Gammaproteobacteria bacterium]